MGKEKGWVGVLAALGGTAALAGGCEAPGSTGFGGGAGCVPGATQSCACAGGGTSAQTCNEAGTGFQPCECGDAGALEPEPDAVAPEVDAGPCDPEDEYASKGCFEDTVFWLDGCGGKTEPIEACNTPQEACVDGACVEACASHAYKDCEGMSAYWFDACENKEELIETCTGAALCSAGECVAACTPHAYQDCHKGDLWWFDACDKEEGLAKACTSEQFCENKTCVKPFYDGGWLTTANPSTKTTAFGNATYLPFLIELDVEAGAATATGEAFGTIVTYTGTIDGKHMVLEASYTDPGGGDHQELWDVNFVALDTFTGIINDNVSVFGVPAGNIVWNITGVKQ